jgi:ATP-dependent exoDNAse (exonuclease V) beta subunit
VSQTADIHNAELFFGLLENQAKAGRMPARSEFILKLALLKAKTQSAGVAKVQVMTIHKAKGLEYDTVIVPGLDRATRSEETAMLLWQTLIDSGGRHRLLLAPIKRSGDKADRMYQFLYQTEQEKASYEAQRLLYVAVTRAKKRLLLLANIVYDEQKQQCVLPAKRSFLAALWPALEASCQAAYQPSHCKAEDESMAVTQCSLRRLPADWSLPALNLWPVQQIEQGIDNVPEPYVPEMSLQRNIGTVVHRYLAEISIQGLSQWNLTKLNLQSSTIAMQLRQLGVSADDLPQAVAEVLRVLSFSLSDNRGRWILSAQTHAQSEYVISSYTPYGLQKWIIDRTFVDEQNRRWVIDYKSSRPLPNESLASFLEREKQQYLPQLSTYAHLLNKQDPSVSCICCGLYFPALDGGWITWEWHANPSQGLLDLH